jgi:DNA-binding MarR family transcriptional regulator
MDSPALQDLNEKINAVYRHGTLLEKYSTLPHDYGEGFVMTEAESHTLMYICQQGEVTVTSLAEYSFRTKGSVSKMLKKLESKGFIARKTKDGNRKWIYFVPTELGSRANEVHLARDRELTGNMIKDLLKDCTEEDIESFYKVTRLRIRYLEENEL